MISNLSCKKFAQIHYNFQINKYYNECEAKKFCLPANNRWVILQNINFFGRDYNFSQISF